MRTSVIALGASLVLGSAVTSHAAVLFAHDFENANITQAEIGGTGVITPGAVNVAVDSVTKYNGLQSGNFADGGVVFPHSAINSAKGTFEAWVYNDNSKTDTGGRIFDWQGQAWNQNSMHIRYDFDLYMIFDIYGSTGTTYKVYTYPIDAGWHHIATTWDTTTASSDMMALYVDGTLRHKLTGLSITLDPTYLANGDVGIGAIAAGINPFKSNIDRVRIYDDVIETVYAIDGGGNFTPSTTLVPEPASLGMLLGAAMLLGNRRRIGQ